MWYVQDMSILVSGSLQLRFQRSLIASKDQLYEVVSDQLADVEKYSFTVVVGDYSTPWRIAELPEGSFELKVLPKETQGALQRNAHCVGFFNMWAARNISRPLPLHATCSTGLY